MRAAERIAEGRVRPPSKATLPAMRASSVITPLTMALALGLSLSGCGEDQRPLVRAKVREFATATRGHDYVSICHDVLAPSLLADLTRVGLSCEQAMAIALGHVSSPRLVIGSIVVRGDRATVLTLSQAAGEKTVLTSLQLVDTRRGWRISSLGSPVG